MIIKTLTNYRKWKHIRNSFISQQGQQKLFNYSEMEVIKEIIQEKPDLYLDELVREIQNRINKTISTSTLSHYLKYDGITHKKIKPLLIILSVIFLFSRLKFISTIGSQYRSDQLIFVDESAKDKRTLNRVYGYSSIGCRIQQNTIFLHGKRYTILPALSLDGYIAIPQMHPFPGPNSVLIMDNTRIYYNNDFIDIVQELGGKVEFLPPYSPDLNLIERSFSVVKMWIKRHREFMENFNDPIHALMLACA
ncbi:hypothetical protein RclHR1_19370007 [Rhizophagus clarus]|uniref:Tc1-like transposase DDE domain-containing protein n=1 Tax=Rhizophagus clarus TaxID=94130 RepID=A0A2Z6RHQ8_9GLOM|nr:hypothetical protein RclHR1_19370007 [Rhizophagus clarus]